jgi:citrate lyase beta subunit
VRVNGADTARGADDLAVLADTPVDGLVIPKVSRAVDLDPARRAAPGVALWAMVETPAALFHLHEIAGAPGLAGLLLGANDLGAALGCRTTPDRAAFQTAMSLTVAAARTHGVFAIDSVFNALEDSEGFAAECDQGRLYGFDGKALIHPSQIAPAHAAFSPGADEIGWARAVVAAYADPENAGLGAIRVAGRQTERLHLAQAERLLALQERVGTP